MSLNQIDRIAAAPVVVPERPGVLPAPSPLQPAHPPLIPEPRRDHPLERPPGIKPEEKPRPKAMGWSLRL